MSTNTLSSRDDLPALLSSAAWLAAALVGALTAWVSPGVVLLLAVVGAALAWAGRRNAPWLGLAQLSAGIFAVLVATADPSTTRLMGVVAVLSLLAVAWQLVVFMRQRRLLEQERSALARQVDRRINEIFSLQELSYVLAESLQSERIASQVARYVTRFLSAEGAAIVLAGPGGTLRVAAAEGSLSAFSGREVAPEPASLVLRAMSSERIEVSRQSLEPLPLFAQLQAANAAAAPLRAHGLTMGVLAVSDRREGSFTAEDLWLLSTVATHVAVVLANSRLFEMIRQAKDEWETAFNAIAEGIAMLDREGRITRSNGALARMIETPATALPGLPFWETVVGEGEGADSLIGAARRGERPAPLLLRSSALQREIRLTAAPLSEGEHGGAVVVLVADVTEQRTLETQLIQSEKLAAVGQLISGVAHELNNPLTSIAGLAEFLQERLAVPAADREHLRVIHEQAERAGRIVRNLLTFARRGSPGSQGFDLNEMAERTARLVAYELELRGVTLEEQRSPQPLPVRGNQDELQQVLVNLVTNAGHALRDLPAGAPRVITLTTAPEGEFAVARVRDTGPGIPDALVPRLFTPFFTTKDPGEGTGLGLSLSFRIAQAHGGTLSYRRSASGGAEFILALPMAREERRTPRRTPEMKLSALLVDGDSKAELIVRALLEPDGYLVDVVRSAAEGSERLQQRAWSLVILDGGLSADGKLLLVDQLASAPDRDPETRVLVSSADPAVAARARAAGFVVLPRPFLPRDLVTVLGK